MRTNDKIRIAVLVALSSGRAAAGDVVFDGTTGAAGNALFDTPSRTFSIRQQDGTLSGTNLFHSFSTFNIDVTETAEFSAIDPVNNVISRVTSLQPTTINGTVRSLIPNANFWFINPAGITVGATGVIDVQGAIALGSADFVEFEGGLQWRALGVGGAAAGALTVNPADFGFLPGSTAGTLSVTNQNFTATAVGEPQINNRSWLLTGGAGVNVVSSNSLLLEDGKIETNRGGNVLVAGAGVEFRNTQIYAPRARVGIASVADPSTLVIDDNADFVFGAVPRESLRPIRFNDYQYAPGEVVHPFVGNIINTSSDSFVGGGVYILGGDITLRSTSINSDSLQGSPADQAAKGIHVRGESLDMNRNTALTSVVRGDEPFFTSDDDGVENDSPAEGDGGSITIEVFGDLTVSGTEDQIFTDGNNFHTQISSRTFSSGDGGNISINAANLTLDGPQSLTGPAPDAAQLSLGGPAAGFIASSNDAVDRNDFTSRSEATGNAGDIDITLSGTLRMQGLSWSQGANPTDPDRATVIGVGGAQIASDTQHVGFLVDGDGNPLGTAGDITINARSLEITGAGQISSSTSGPARGGNIGITLTDGHLSMSTDPSATFTSGIFTRATSAADNPQFGNAGNITIDVVATDPAEGYVTLSGVGQNGLGSRLFSDATFAQGNAGTISVDASGDISLTGASVRTDVAGSQQAFAGDITLRSDALVTLDNSLVSSQSTSANAAGNITVAGSGVLIHRGSQLLADYNNAGSNPGEPGSINITATGASNESRPQDVRDQATTGVVRIIDSGVNANNNGGGDDADRGDITILADDIVVAGSVIATDVIAGGVGDDIVLRGDRSVSLLHSDGPGFALRGIVIPPIDPRGDITRSLVSARTQASAAAGGLIRVEVGSGGVITVEDSNIDTSTSIDGSNVNPDRVRSNIALLATGGSIETSGAVLTTQSTGLDPAGNIQVSGNQIELSNTTLRASTAGSGDAGSIRVTSSPTGSIFIGNGSKLLSDASQGVPAFDFDTGQILVQLPNAGTVEVIGGTGGVEINGTEMASSAGPNAGQAGTVTVTSAGTLSMSGTDVSTSVETGRTVGPGTPGPALNPAQIALSANGAVSLTDTNLGSETFGAIDAGSISVTGSEITVSGGEITAATFDTGDAGTVTLTANSGATRVIDGATVSTSSEGPQAGQAGIITISGNGVELAGATVTTAVASTVGGLTPARIDLNAGTGDLSLTGSTLSAATSGTASAGNINLLGGSVSVSGGSITASAVDQATSSTNLGGAGTISITGTDVTLTGANLSTATDSDITSTSPARIILDASGTLSLTDTSLSAATTGAADAGDVVLTGASISMSGGSITASTTSTGDAGIVTIIADTGGDVDLTDGASVETSARDVATSSTNLGEAGTITVRGADVTLAEASLSTSTDSNIVTSSPATIELTAVGALSLTNTGISADTTGAASAGNITLNGATIAMDGGSASSSAVGGNSSETTLGAAGTIDLNASTITLANASLTTTTDSDVATLTAAEISLEITGALSLTNTDLSASTTGAASAGNITLGGSSITMSGGSATASTTSTGDAGAISIVAATGGNVSITDGANIATSSSGATSGAAGTILVSGANVTLADAGFSTAIGSDDTTLAPAAIDIDATGALLLTSTTLSSATSGAAAAGNITLDGVSIAMSGGSISASTNDLGDAGDVTLTATNAASVTNGASIETSSTGANSGEAGIIDINGSSITLAGAEVNTSTQANDATQTAARIDLTTVGALSLTNTNLSASTTGAASAGNLTLGGSSITMSGGSATASTTSTGDAGAISIVAATGGNVSITDGANIATSSSGATSGAAGTILVRGANVTLANAGFSTAIGSDDTTLAAAAIDIDASGALLLTNTTLSSATSGAAAAGNITLDGASIAMSGGSISASTNDLGDAGDVTLTATNAASVTNGASIETSSTGANSGEAGIVDINGSSIMLTGADITTSTQANDTTQTAARIDLTTVGALSLTDTNLSASTSGAASAGNITLAGSSIAMSGGSATASTTAAGDAGAISIVAAAGGNVSITNGADIATSSSGATSGAAGTIRVSGANVTLADAGFSTAIGSDDTTLAPAAIDVDATGALALTNTTLSAATSGAAAAGNITLDGVSIAMSGGSISASTTDLGDAGDVRLTATNAASVTNGASIETSSSGATSGEAGTIAITGSSITLAGAEVNTSTQANDTTQTPARIDLTTPGALSLTDTNLSASTSGAVSAGDITLTGNSIAMAGGTVTAATTDSGNAGNVALTSANAVDVTNGATIATSSAGANSGAAGTIAITGSRITLANADVTTSIASNNAALAPAQIGISTPGALALTSTTLNAATSGASAAGNILLSGGSITMNDGEITARTTGSGNAGRVALTAPGTVQISNGAVLETSSVGAASGAAGRIDVHGSQISLANTRVATSVQSSVPGLAPAAITLAATGSTSLTAGTDVDATTSGAAPGGSIVISGSAILVDESSVSSQTTGAGDAGSVCLAAGSNACTPDASGRARILVADIPAAGGITLSGGTLTTSTTGSGSAGNVGVHASGTLLLLNSTLQSSSSATSNAGNGGSINLSSGLSDELLIENSMVQTDAEAAEGGDITLDGGGSTLSLKNSVLFASAGANGNGGDVTIDNVDTTLIDHSLILAQADRGTGGSILLTLQDGATFLQDSQSLINADSQQGINGEVSINRPNTDLNSSIQPQEVDVSKPAELGSDVCAPSTPGARSTFVREGRGGVAESPDSYLTTMPAAGAKPERTSATGKSEPVAKTAARSPTEPGSEKATRGCF